MFCFLSVVAERPAMTKSTVLEFRAPKRPSKEMSRISRLKLSSLARAWATSISKPVGFPSWLYSKGG